MDYPFKYEVNRRLNGKPYLRPVFGDLHNIAERIRDIDPTLFIVRNLKNDCYEVHSLDHYPSSYAWVVPYRYLDVRTLRRARKGNILMRGRAVFDDIDKHNAKQEASFQREFENEMDARAREARSLFARTAWEM
jgi:hypothetical protein